MRTTLEICVHSTDVIFDHCNITEEGDTVSAAVGIAATQSAEPGLTFQRVYMHRHAPAGFFLSGHDVSFQEEPSPGQGFCEYFLTKEENGGGVL